jgi:hypothetical protein
MRGEQSCSNFDVKGTLGKEQRWFEKGAIREFW